MKLTALETVRLDEFPNVLWVRLHTDEGLTGLGETFFGARAVEAYLHESAAALSRPNRQCENFTDSRSEGVEMAGFARRTRVRARRRT